MKSKVSLIASVIAGGLGILLFTLATFGVFSDKPLDAAQSILSRSEFGQTNYAVILPDSFFKNAKDTSFARRFTSQSDNMFVCSVSADQFKSLKAIKKISTHVIKLSSHSIDVAEVSGDENFDMVTGILTRESLQQCTGAKLKRFFYIDSPKTISG